MGCSGSRLKNINPESIPARFRPILRRRIEEVQRRRRLGSTKDESTKEELLYKAYDHDIVDVDSVALDEREKEVVVEKREVDHEVMILDDDDDTDESSVIFPGSPSFRIYFVDNGDDDDNDDDDDRVLEIIKEEGVKEKKQSSGMDALEEQEPEAKTTVKRRRSLREISKGGQTAVKNLLNVKGCYTPSCGTRPGRAHLISSNP